MATPKVLIDKRRPKKDGTPYAPRGPITTRTPPADDASVLIEVLLNHGELRAFAEICNERGLTVSRALRFYVQNAIEEAELRSSQCPAPATAE